MSEPAATEPSAIDDEVFGAENAAGEEIRIPLMQEDLTATTRPVEGGTVRILKRVVSVDQVLDVPATDELIRVERRIVDRPGNGGETQAFEQIIIEIPLRRDIVEALKQARVTEEIVVTKETVRRIERVADTVRHEKVIVEGDAILVDDTEGEAPRRS